MRYRVNSPTVISESFDDEVVVIDFENGMYYSLRGTGRAIWLGIESSSSAAEIAELLAARHDGEAGEIEEAVLSFVAELESNGLIAPLEGSDGASGKGVVPPPVERSAFSPPVITRYTDMQELLLLDPIHEVDESGWPQRRAE